MARYILLTATFGSPPNRPAQKFGRGTVIADSTANALPGDVIWPALCAAAPTSKQMIAPLDASASAALGAPIVTLAQIASNPGFGNVGTNHTHSAGTDAGN